MSRKDNALIFLAGSVIGAAAAGRFFRSKYEAISKEEIDSVKNTFSRRLEQTKSDSGQSDTEESSVDTSDKFYIISEDEFGMNDGYETGTLFRYSDGIITDSDDKVMEKCDNIGKLVNSANISMYGADSIYIRSDARKTDYEVLFDDRTFFEKREGDAST